MVALNNLNVDKGTKTPVNPVIHSYYADKCKNKKKNVAVGAVMHKICNIILPCSGIINRLRSSFLRNTVSDIWKHIQTRHRTQLNKLP